MADLNLLYSKKNQYQNLKSSINHLVNSLRIASDYLIDADEHLVHCYRLDDERADHSEIAIQRTNLMERQTYLQGTVLPAIDVAISRLDQEINLEIRRQEEERLRAEAAYQEALRRAASSRKVGKI